MILRNAFLLSVSKPWVPRDFRPYKPANRIAVTAAAHGEVAMGGKDMDRRSFMVKTAAGLIGAGLYSPAVPTVRASTVKPSEIVCRTLGRTGLQIPVVSFGVMNSDSPDLIRKALDMGVKHLDTAHAFQRATGFG